MDQRESDRLKLEWLHSPPQQIKAIVEFMNEHNFPTHEIGLELQPFGRLCAWYEQANKACTGRLIAVGVLCGLAGLIIGWFVFGG